VKIGPVMVLSPPPSFMDDEASPWSSGAFGASPLPHDAAAIATNVAAISLNIHRATMRVFIMRFVRS
jgi:hypothetical protein